MSKKICIIMDYGHRLTTPGKRTMALPRVIHERTMNEGYGSIVAGYFRAMGAEVLEVAPDKNLTMNENTDLNQRISKANAWFKQMKAKYGDIQCHYISCHANAGGGQGAEVWIWSKSAKGGPEERAASAVLNALCSATGMRNRGVKRGYVGAPASDFAVNRDTVMTSMLVECGFMDYKPEAEKMDNPAFWEICGRAVYEGWCKYAGVTPVAANGSDQIAPDGKVFAVQTGAFKSKKNAENYAADLEKKGVKTYITEKDV